MFLRDGVYRTLAHSLAPSPRSSRRTSNDHPASSFNQLPHQLVPIHPPHTSTSSRRVPLVLRCVPPVVAHLSTGSGKVPVGPVEPRASFEARSRINRRARRERRVFEDPAARRPFLRGADRFRGSKEGGLPCCEEEGGTEGDGEEEEEDAEPEEVGAGGRRRRRRGSRAARGAGTFVLLDGGGCKRNVARRGVF